MDRDVSANGSAFLQQDRGGANVPLDRRRGLHFDTPGYRQRATQTASNHHLSRFDITDDFASGGDDESIGTVQRSLDAAVDAHRSLGVEVARYGELIVNDGIAGG